MAFYLVRVGEGSKYIEQAKAGSYIAIGWNEVPDLSHVKRLEEIKTVLSTVKADYTPNQMGSAAGQLFRFAKDIQAGDTILSPLQGGEYLTGTVGDYYHEATPQDSCPYQHRRRIEWNSQPLQKEDMSTSLAYSLGGLLTVYSIDTHASELQALIDGETYTPAEKPLRVRDVILDGLMELDGRQFEHFVSHLLGIIGFSAEATQYVGDKGIDVNGVLNAEGLANITLRVQVKRVNSTIGNKDVLSLRGALAQAEHGCLVTLSNFSASALQEAEAPGKVPIKLIDGQDLAGLILKHFDELDDQYRGLFSIRKRSDFKIEEQFEVLTEDGEEPEADRISGDKKTGGEAPIWDTIICPAKEEGFKQAFLGDKAWWAIRIKRDNIPDIKYIAIYQVAPISQITYYGEVDRIERYRDSSKYKVLLKGEPIKLDAPVKLGENRNLKLQGPRYAKLTNIEKARTLDELFSQ